MALSRDEQTFRIQQVYAFTHHMCGINTYTCVHVLWQRLLLGTDPKDSAPPGTAKHSGAAGPRCISASAYAKHMANSDNLS